MHPRIIALAAAYTAAISLMPRCSLPMFSQSPTDEMRAATDANNALSQTVVQNDGQAALATAPQADPLQTVTNAALSALVVVAVVALFSWLLRRLSNGRKPPTLAVALAITAAGCTGCWSPKPPATSLKVDRWSRSLSFHDSKDNRVLLEGMDVDTATGAAHVDKLEIDNRASPVIEQQILQMYAWNAQMSTANQGIKNTLDGLHKIAAQLAAVVAALPPVNPPATPAPTATITIGD